MGWQTILRWKATRGALGLLAGSGLLAGCSSAPVQLAVDPALRGGEVYTVAGATARSWNEAVRFGGFSTTPKAEGVGRLAAPWLFDEQGYEATAPHRFVFLDEGGGEWKVECLTRTTSRTPLAGDGRATLGGPYRLSCTMESPAGREDTLSLIGQRRQFGGSARSGEREITVDAVHRVTDGAGREYNIGEVAGYELRLDGRLLASVDVRHDRRVYFAPGIEPDLRGPVAVTSSLLLLYIES